MVIKRFSMIYTLKGERTSKSKSSHEMETILNRIEFETLSKIKEAKVFLRSGRCLERNTHKENQSGKTKIAEYPKMGRDTFLGALVWWKNEGKNIATPKRI